jgi:hypothetical protein
MPSHLYVVVTCKTKGCKNICALKYLGPDIGAIEIGEMAPTGVQYECGQCSSGVSIRACGVPGGAVSASAPGGVGKRMGTLDSSALIFPNKCCPVTVSKLSSLWPVCVKGIVAIVSPHPAMPYAKINPKNLDTACIIEEEPNSAHSVVSRLTGTGPGACRTFWPQRGETNKCIDGKSARTSSGLIQHAIYPVEPI